MDKIYEKLLKNVLNVEQYTSVTKEITDKYKNQKVNLNMTIALIITKVRSLEIEYFSKSQENGAAGYLFDRLLGLPPSKTWSMMNKELISTLQYWLRAITNRVRTNNNLWWRFLKFILKLIKEIRVKHPSMPDKLVELMTGGLLDLAVTGGLSVKQQHEILHCVNVYCEQSSREVRFALRSQFTDYFTKLALQLPSCGYLPLQWTALEALLRWLVPRGEPSLRAAAAAAWFPPGTCPDDARSIFLNAKWMNFFHDARAFLSAVNNATGLVTSVICKRLFVGDMLVVSGAESRLTWIDINSNVGSISVLLDPRVLQSFEDDFRACNTLVIEAGSTSAVRLHRESEEVTLTVTTDRPLRAPPRRTAGEGSDVGVIIIISSKTDVKTLDSALRAVFGDTYQLCMSLDGAPTPATTPEPRSHHDSSEESRFSHPVEQRKRTVGFEELRNRNKGSVPRVGVAWWHPSRLRAGSLASPSTASTTSLANLHDKLATLPGHHYAISHYDRVCLKPQLSTVTEVSVKAEIRSTQSKSTLVYEPLHVGVASYRRSEKKPEIDSDKQIPEINTRSDVSHELSNSCLLVATLGNDESAINDAIEHLSQSTDFQTTNIVDLLVQEALAESTNVQVNDSLSQHIGEAGTGTINCSPELVRQINTSTSNTIQSSEKNCLIDNQVTNIDVEQFEINDNDVIECTSNLVDQVCKSLFLYSSTNINLELDSERESNSSNALVNNKTNTTIKSRKSGRKIKTKPKSVAKKDNMQTTKMKSSKKMSTIIERNDEEHLETGSSKRKVKTTKVAKTNNPTTNKTDGECLSDKNVSAKKKRKLYSPKDDEIMKENKVTALSEDSEDDNIKLVDLKSREIIEAPKTTAAFYKEIEKQKRTRRRHSIISRKSFQKSPSPSTLENDAIFDNLRATMEYNEKVTFVVPKSADEVYNSSSSSEDSVFEIKKSRLRKRKSKAASSESSMSAKPGKQNIRRPGKTAIDKPKKTKQARKNQPKRTKTKPLTNIRSVIDLDEVRMRSGNPEEVLNTSMVIAKPVNTLEKIDLILDNPPKMEPMIYQESPKPAQSINSIKDKDSKIISDNSGTLSPLPGLTIEAVAKGKNDTGELFNAEMQRKMHFQLQEQILDGGQDALNEASNNNNEIMAIDLDIENHLQNFSINETNEYNFAEIDNFAPRNEKHTTEKRKLNENADNIGKVKNIKKEKFSANKIVKKEVIKIPDLTDIQSEKSISTDGIRAHVDSDDHPPSPGLLERSISPREVVDMTTSMKKSYVTFNQQLYDAIPRQRSETSEDDLPQAFLKCPNESPYKLLNITDKITSQRTSEKSSPAPSKTIHGKPKSPQRKHSKIEITKQQTRNVSNQSIIPRLDSPKTKIPIVSMTRLSSEDLDRWSMPRSLRSSFRSQSTVSSKSNNPTHVYNTRKKYKNITFYDSDEFMIEDDKIEDREEKTLRREARSKAKERDSNSVAAKKASKRKRSVISPVMIPPLNEELDLSPPRNVPDGTKQKRLKKNASSTVAESYQDLLSSNTSPIVMPKDTSKKRLQESYVEIMEPTKRRTKQRSVSPISVGESIQIMNTADSGPSASSVYDWFQRNQSSKRDDDNLCDFKDILKSVMEKLNTTMVESNRSTSKKFVEFFMQVQQHMAERRRQLEICKAAINRQEEINAQFMEHLKSNMTDVIRRDRAQKELAVALLREDIQAGLDHIDLAESKRA